MLYISYKDVAKLLEPADVIGVAEDTLRTMAADRVTWSKPSLMTLRSEKVPSSYRAKLCVLDEIGIGGFRLVGTPQGSGTKQDGPPTRLVVLNDTATAQFIAIVDERWSYAMRTGAGVAFAFKHLCPPDTDTVGLIGAGLMQHGTLHALRAVMPLKTVVVWSRTNATRDAFIAEARAQTGLEIVPADSAQEVLERTLAVCVSTKAREPFVKAGWLRPGCTVYSMGQNQELEFDCYTAVDKFLVDDWDAVGHKADMAQLQREGWDRSRLHADFVQLVTGERPGRESPEERIMVRSEGLAPMDVSLSYFIYQRARERGLGQEILVE